MSHPAPDSVPSEPRLREQLILAQVRLMEMEDARDEVADRLARTGELLRAAQQLADSRLAAEAQAAGRADALAAELRAATDALASAQRAADEARVRADALAAELDAARTGHAAANARAEALGAELLTLKSTRSWRWTAWLRALTGGDPRP